MPAECVRGGRPIPEIRGSIRVLGRQGLSFRATMLPAIAGYYRSMGLVMTRRIHSRNRYSRGIERVATRITY